jgi:hypothetical protein
MRWLLLFGLLLAACSKGPQADLPSIGEARSLGAEWALVNEQQASGHVTAAYADSMRGRLREELETDLTSLSQPQSPYGAEIRALLAADDDASPAELRGHVRALKQIEDGLESA